MKKSLKNLQLKKQTISKLNLNNLKGGFINPTALGCQPSVFTCNTVPEAEGGIGCHIF